MSPVWGAETSSEAERKEEREKRQQQAKRNDRRPAMKDQRSF